MEARPGAGPSPAPSAGAALVFAGCGAPEVALAQSFWNSATLQPPLESRLSPRRASGGGSAATASATTLGSRRDSAGLGLGPRRSHADAQKSGPPSQASVTSRKGEIEIQIDPEVERVDEQKAEYIRKAKRREEILALLRKQREERILKEAVSRPHRPKTTMEESKLKVAESDAEDEESVKALI